ncbi:penicillin-binding protein 1A [Desulfobacula phenolica]|uniref:Penicillin-binding protein 1A n=1 Tax=Desulfobacula phenolica TaxID=90732 RepID=A0A1H2DWU2_9BACT|nr:PBP1A family penicillin-binding protein [Desulfobacula phenolica]SDT87310.1 penicillin-binding protein 1A [Desulfobacula phenolica]
MTFFLRFSKLIRFCLFAGLIFVSLACLAGMFLVFYVAKDLPKLPSPLSRIIETPQTRVFDSNGQVLITLGERNPIPLNMVSRDFINAIIATEDHRFFDHHGVNKLRILKGLYVTLFQSGNVQGASTITQQLAKNLFFSFEKTYTRKFKELLVALQIEASNTKQEILHAYINQIHFGAGAQGVEKAARVFFGKSAFDLSLPEAALLAGLPKSPTNYNPYRHYDRALARRDIVLKRMVQTGLISDLEARQAMSAIPELYHEESDSRTGSYFVDALINELISTYGEDVVYHGGLKVFATMDKRLQSYASQSIKKGLERLDTMMGIKAENRVHPQGALVAIDTGSGAVKAMVGGKNYYKSEFNRAVKARRQPGSGFKPFVYYAAFKQLGWHPATIMTDKPVIIPVKGAADWKPKNFTKTFSGDMILKKALINSVNTIAAQLVEKIGPDAVIRIAKACGIQSPLKNVYSIALGTSTITPFEMASAYTVFATLGIRHEPFFFRRVEDALGRVIFEHIVQEKRVLEPSIAYQVVDMMKSVIDRGSGRSVRQLGFNRVAAGKTGTTDNYNDAWFTGFTPNLCTSVWIGFDRKKRLTDINKNGITGGKGAAPIWAEFMINALKSDPERDFSIPDDIRFETVDIITGCTPKEENSIAEFLTVPLKQEQFLCVKEEK